MDRAWAAATLLATVLVVAVMLSIGWVVGHPNHAPAISPDGNSITVHGHVYDMADDRPGCWASPSPTGGVRIDYHAHISDVRGLGFEVGCP